MSNYKSPLTLKSSLTLNEDDFSETLSLSLRYLYENDKSFNPFTLKAIKHKLKKCGISERKYKKYRSAFKRFEEKERKNPKLGLVRKGKLTVLGRKFMARMSRTIQVLKLEYVQDVANTKRKFLALKREEKKWAEKYAKDNNLIVN